MLMETFNESIKENPVFMWRFETVENPCAGDSIQTNHTDQNNVWKNQFDVLKVINEFNY